MSDEASAFIEFWVKPIAKTGADMLPVEAALRCLLANQEKASPMCDVRHKRPDDPRLPWPCINFAPDSNLGCLYLHNGRCLLKRYRPTPEQRLALAEKLRNAFSSKEDSNER